LSGYSGRRTPFCEVFLSVPATFPLDIVTPERTVLSEEVTSLQVPAVDGSLGILAGHAPLLAELGVGDCVVRLSTGAEEHLALAGGFVEVSRERVTVLADTAEFSHEIDPDRAEQTLARARELLGSVNETPDRAELAASVQRAQNRLRIARGGGNAAGGQP
jgi:F-type H+-transporting ATPase subunit epsilon